MLGCFCEVPVLQATRCAAGKGCFRASRCSVTKMTGQDHRSWPRPAQQCGGLPPRCGDVCARMFEVVCDQHFLHCGGMPFAKMAYESESGCPPGVAEAIIAPTAAVEVSGLGDMAVALAFFSAGVICELSASIPIRCFGLAVARGAWLATLRGAWGPSLKRQNQSLA